MSPSQVPQRLLDPAIMALYEITNPILIILIVLLIIAIMGLSWVIYKLYLRLMDTIKNHKEELKEKEKQIEEIYELIYNNSKTDLEAVLSFENKIDSHLKRDEFLTKQVTSIKEITNNIRTQLEWFLKTSNYDSKDNT